MKTTGVAPTELAASISWFSRSEIDAMPTPLQSGESQPDPSPSQFCLLAECWLQVVWRRCAVPVGDFSAGQADPVADARAAVPVGLPGHGTQPAAAPAGCACRACTSAVVRPLPATPQ